MLVEYFNIRLCSFDHSKVYIEVICMLKDSERALERQKIEKSIAFCYALGPIFPNKPKVTRYRIRFRLGKSKRVVQPCVSSQH